MSMHKDMPRRVPSDLDERINRMIQLWETIGPNKEVGDLSLSIVRNKVTDRQKAKNARLLTEKADKDARTLVQTHDEEIYDMTIQTLQVASFLYGSNSPEYKLAGGTPMSERGRNGHKTNKPNDGTTNGATAPTVA